MPFMPAQPAPPNFIHRLLNVPPEACCPHDAPLLGTSAAPSAAMAGTTAARSAAVLTSTLVAKPAAPTPRRAKLAELDANLHCSIIGTCLTTGELRKLVPRYAPQLDRKTASDLDIHHTAVELSMQGEVAAKELHKALDSRHALAIKRFKPADERALALLWSDALAQGDVPGAYWALLTHPLCSFDLRRQAFGDVHMLSHLVGASNRADLRRLGTLEDDNARLREQNAALQARLHELGAQHQHAVDVVAQQSMDLSRLRERHAGLAQSAAADQLAQLRDAVAARDDQLAQYAARNEELQARLAASDAAAELTRNAARQLGANAEQARAEAQALEQALEQALLQTFHGGSDAAALPPLQGRRVVYVGGRPQSTQMLARLVAAAGGELLAHDGGIEDRKGMLAALLPRADMVVFPVDCISHNAMHVTRQLAARAGVPCHPVRNAGIASFVELMQRHAVQ